MMREISIRREKFRFAYAERIIDLANARIFVAVSDYLNERRTQLLKRRPTTAFSRSSTSWESYWTAFEAKMLREWSKSINSLRYNQWSIPKRLRSEIWSEMLQIWWIAWWSEMLRIRIVWWITWWRGEMLQIWIVWWSEMLQFWTAWRGEMLQNSESLDEAKCFNSGSLKRRNASKFEPLGGAKCFNTGPLDEAKCFNTESLNEGAKCFKTGSLGEAKCFKFGSFDGAKCSDYSGLNTASSRGVKAGGVCWMMGCRDRVRDRKDSWSRDSTSSDFHMYETTWFSAHATIRFWSIALRSIHIVNLLISKWSRFAAQWRADLLILRRWPRNQAPQARPYEDGRWVKHSRHDRAGDDRARRALNGAVKLPRDGDLGPRMTR